MVSAIMRLVSHVFDMKINAATETFGQEMTKALRRTVLRWYSPPAGRFVPRTCEGVLLTATVNNEPFFEVRKEMDG